MFMRIFERGEQVGGGEDSELSYLVSPFLNINETSGLHCLHLQIILHDLESPPNLLAPFRKDSTPLAQRRVTFHFHVVARITRHWLVALNPAAGLGRFESFLKEHVPVRDTPKEPPHMNEVKGSRGKRPCARIILDFTFCDLV